MHFNQPNRGVPERQSWRSTKPAGPVASFRDDALGAKGAGVAAIGPTNEPVHSPATTRKDGSYRGRAMIFRPDVFRHMTASALLRSARCVAIPLTGNFGGC